MSHLSTDELEFHLEEYKILKAEIAELFKQVGDHASLALSVGGALAAWLVANSAAVRGSPLVWFLPVLTSSVLGLLALSKFLRMMTKGRYLRKLEDALGSSEFGWEKFSGTDASGIFWANFGIWGSINCSYFGFAILMVLRQPG